MSNFKKGELPAVGEKCLARLRGCSLGWMESTFKGGYDSKIWFGTVGCEHTVPAHDVEFKPVTTIEERAIDDLMSIEPLARKDHADIVEAIKAGAIRGVKWVGEQ